MSGVLVRSAWIYEKLLRLYPEDLRRDYGSEMVLAFADDLEAAWGGARVAGVIRIWWHALRELLTVALPGQRSNPSVLVPAWAFALCACTQSAELWIGSHMARGVAYPPLLQSIAMIVVPSLVNALVSFIVTRVYARSSIAALQLD
jgi:hypothetical protein